MTSHETRSTHTTRTKGSSAEQNDLKKLKSKYSAKLPTLKVLFSDWSDDDLLFVLEEANGDLDLTIDRISEGNFFFEALTNTQKANFFLLLLLLLRSLLKKNSFYTHTI
jgi:hypothetical protein